MAYKVYWDNGNSACGTFPQVFATEAAAEAFANDWASERNLEDLGLTDADVEECGGEGCYTAEVIEFDENECHACGNVMGLCTCETPLAKILNQLPATAALTDANGESFLVCDIDPAGDTKNYIRDGDDIILMDARGEQRQAVAYRITV